MIDSNLQRFRQLARDASDSDEFYRQFVDTFAQVSGAEMGLAWIGQESPFQPTCQFLRRKDASGHHPLSSDQHNQLLREVQRRGKAMLATPPKNSAPGTPALLVGPLQFRSQQRILEFILPGVQSPAENEHALNQFNDACRIAASVATSNVDKATQTNAIAAIDNRTLDEFVSSIHQSVDPKSTANTIANEARRALGVDRVSVFYRHGRKFRCEAISGQPSVNRRSNTVAALSTLVNRIAKTKRVFWFPAEESHGDKSIVPQIDQPLNDYITQSMTRSLAVVPVNENVSADDEVDSQVKQPAKVAACLVIEHVAAQWDRAEVEPAIDTVCRHSGDAIRNANQVQRIFLYPLWRAIGNTRAVVMGRNLPRTLLVAVAIVGMACAMLFIQTDFYLTSEGTLEPTRRQRVFADQDAVVRAVQVKHGDRVAQGETLLTMENSELEIQIAQLTGEMAALEQRLQGSRSMRIDGSEERQRVNRKEIESQIKSLQSRLATVQQKKSRLQLVAPINGEVLTWDLASRLKDRPVRQGELLLEIANPTDPWRLELDLPNRKYGHLAAAVNEIGQELPVKFSLASAPGKQFTGTIASIDEATSINSQQLHVIRIWVDVDGSSLGDLKHPGSAVQAKIECGKRSLGFVWLHEIWEFVQYKVLFHVW